MALCTGREEKATKRSRTTGQMVKDLNWVIPFRAREARQLKSRLNKSTCADRWPPTTSESVHDRPEDNKTADDSLGSRRRWRHSGQGPLVSVAVIASDQQLVPGQPSSQSEKHEEADPTEKKTTKNGRRLLWCVKRSIFLGK